MPESQRQHRAIVSKQIVVLTDAALILLMANESHPSSDEIHIEQLEVSTRIGVLEEERAAPQRLTISISFWPYQQTRDLDDNIQHAVNYSAVAEETKSFVRDQSTSLIETLADELAKHLLKSFPIQKVTVEVRKFPLEDAKHVSVILTRASSVG
jgi:dihydroneopterin aldolase